MPRVKTCSQGGFVDPQLVCSYLEVAAGPHERVRDGMRRRQQVPGSGSDHSRLGPIVLASSVPSAQVLELVCESAPPLHLPEPTVKPDARLSIAGTPHAWAEFDVVDDDVREGAEVAPRVGPVHATRQ